MLQDRRGDVVELDESVLTSRGGVKSARTEPLARGEYHPEPGASPSVRETDNDDVRTMGGGCDDVPDLPVDRHQLLVVWQCRLDGVGWVDVAWVADGAHVHQRGGAG